MPLSILVIDDDLGICALLKEILVCNGHQVDIANDGIAGLEQFYRLQPDLLIVDVTMPKLDGFSVLKEIRRQNIFVGVLMISGLQQTHLVDSLLANGADGYLHKPFQLAELLNEVERVSTLVRLRHNALVGQPS